MSEERKKRRWRLVAIVIALLAIIVFGGRILIGKILLSRIQTSVKENLNANLSADSLSYRPPYSFVLHHCHFELPHHDAPPDLIDVAELRVTLDRLPFGGGPVLVKEIHMIDPVVQVAKSPAKIIDLQSLTSGSSESEEENGKKKPSQIVQIGRLKIEGGQILLQDSTPQRNTWAKIQLNMDATAASPSDYNFKITEAGPIARFDSDGSANVDHRIVSLDQFSFAADMNAPAPAADPLEQLIQQNHLRGYLGVNGTLYINSRHPAQNHGWVALTAKDVSGNLPVADTSIDALQLNAVASADRQGAMLSFSKFFVKSGQTSLGLDGGMIKTTGGALHATGLTGEYGDDRFTTSMDWPLISAEHGIVRLTNIDGVMNFHPPIADYPDPLDKIFAQFRPAGPWEIKGWIIGDIASGKVLNYDLQVASSGDASANITVRDINLTGIKSSWEILPEQVEINDFQCSALGGNLQTDGSVACVRPYKFGGEVTTHKADLSQIAALLQAKYLDKSQFHGLVNLSAKFDGSGPYEGKRADALFTAAGQFEIHKGVLWDIPVLKRIADSATIAQKALTLSEAAAFFRIENKRVLLRDAAINAPVLGLEGSGSVDFDGNLNMYVQAAPLADWQSKIDRTRIPIVSTVAGDFAGIVQSLFNKATGALLYTFHITGNALDPNVTTIPAPAITLGTARLFGYMLKPGHDGLLGLLQNPSSQPSTQTTTESSSQP